jgi:aminodeoxyfutalosine deaminase
VRPQENPLPHATASQLDALPKAELHLHLEGSIEPRTVIELAARHGVTLTLEQAAARYSYRDFLGFLDAFKWVTSFLRTPADYALIAERLAELLLSQNVLYAEVTIAGGVMLYRRQDLHANFTALRDVASRARKDGLRLNWIIDATRQFGSAAAMDVARLSADLVKEGVVAFGMGGDELAVPTIEFRAVYEFAAAQGLRRLAHAGEVGGPESVREAVEFLGAERIGHGIAVLRDPRVMDFLAARNVPLEICPTSNLLTGALTRQLDRSPDPNPARIEDHPLRQFVRRGLAVTLSTDDPAMFHTRLTREYALGLRMGLRPDELVRIAEMGFEFSFLPTEEKAALLSEFRARAAALGLL